MTEKELIILLERERQDHITGHFRGLSPRERLLFLEGLESIDMDLVFHLHREITGQCSQVKARGEMEPAPVVSIPRTEADLDRMKRARREGEVLLRGGKVAALIVAGGQGTRLGHEGSKGTFPISPVRKKSFFQLFAEQVAALSRRYGTTLPLLIMTSRKNHDETTDFFKSNQYFGLEQDSVHFFAQAMLPTITPEGKLILKDRTTLLTNPDGHGGSLKSLYDSGLCSRLLGSGITELCYCQVDNPLVRIADPLFLGYHRIADAECSTKVVRRRNLQEKVGIYLRLEGKDRIIEYSEGADERLSALDGNGGLLYWAGNTAIHIFSLPFIRRINEGGYMLPSHCAVKSVEGIVEEPEHKTMDGWKFETFVFDAIPLAQRTCAVEVLREEEFSPVKNGEGSDSPATARQDMAALYRRWLKEAGTETSEEAVVEISPLFALDQEEFASRFKERIQAGHIRIGGRLYLG